MRPPCAWGTAPRCASRASARRRCKSIGCANVPMESDEVSKAWMSEVLGMATSLLSAAAVAAGGLVRCGAQGGAPAANARRGSESRFETAKARRSKSLTAIFRASNTRIARSQSPNRANQLPRSRSSSRYRLSMKRCSISKLASRHPSISPHRRVSSSATTPRLSVMRRSFSVPRPRVSGGKAR